MKAISASTAGLFGALSRLRGRRIFHPHGAGFAATLVPATARRTGANLFDDGLSRRAIVRVSRSVGLPESLPDPCGLGIRVLDAYGAGRSQDLLLVSSATAPGTRHLIAPARGFADRPYSSLLPYRLNGSLRMIGAIAVEHGPGPTLAALRKRDRGELTFRLLIATIRGEWQPVADLELEERLAEDEVENLRLDPGNTGGNLELAGFLNRLREPAYNGSQEGRGARERPRPSAPRGIARSEGDGERAEAA